jgi:glutaredoxin 3
MKPQVIIYTTGYCSFCAKAKDLLNKKQISFTEIRIDLQPELREEMITKSKRHTVPQIFINNHHIGGCDDLHALEAQGKLDQLLQGKE